MSGDASSNAGATVYSGRTVVGSGSGAAQLTAAQILQNTLTINAGSTVTILPSGPGMSAVAASDSSTAASSVVPAASAPSSDSSADSSSDPFLAIQAAIASGAISSVKGEQLENRIAAIERLAATDPGLDVSLLENRVLSSLPSSIWTSADAASLVEIGSGLLTVDSSTFASGSSGASAAFAPSAGFDGGSPAAVPEPSTLLLTAMGALGLAFAGRRRAICRSC